ncbi:hypothetical protein BJY01DRAFT_59562 [Aspergillus pseudoustus]|uniref:Uncharacterized protein n=1 Tax=Aspergillus pseudoustus TaxID=1810923 RepID=A0ABR4JAW8_9EURO
MTRSTAPKTCSTNPTALSPRAEYRSAMRNASTMSSLYSFGWQQCIQRTAPVTLVYSVAILVYNEGQLARFALLKNVLGGVGLGCYC